MWVVTLAAPLVSLACVGTMGGCAYGGYLCDVFWVNLKGYHLLGASARQKTHMLPGQSNENGAATQNYLLFRKPWHYHNVQGWEVADCPAPPR